MRKTGTIFLEIICRYFVLTILLELLLYHWYIAPDEQLGYDLFTFIIHLYSSSMYRAAVAISRMIRRS